MRVYVHNIHSKYLCTLFILGQELMFCLGAHFGAPATFLPHWSTIRVHYACFFHPLESIGQSPLITSVTQHPANSPRKALCIFYGVYNLSPCKISNHYYQRQEVAIKELLPYMRRRKSLFVDLLKDNTYALEKSSNKVRSTSLMYLTHTVDPFKSCWINIFECGFTNNHHHEKQILAQYL